jgi:hypothetical protein
MPWKFEFKLAPTFSPSLLHIPDLLQVETLERATAHGIWPMRIQVRIVNSWSLDLCYSSILLPNDGVYNFEDI